MSEGLPVDFRPDGHGTRPLLGPRRRAGRHGRRDQARLPPARPAVAPRRQPGAGRRRAVQGDQRGLPGPVRSAAPPGVRHVRAAGRRRRPGFGAAGLRRLRRHLRRVLRRDAGRRRGAATRSPAPTSATTSGSRFEEAVKGAEKEIEFTVLGRCETCTGSGAAPGSEAVTCDQCGGRGEIRTTRRTMLGQMVNVSTCPRCQGEGKLIDDPCPTCKGDGRTERKRTLQVTIPAGHRRGPPDPAVERGRGRAARRAAGQPLRRGPRRCRTRRSGARARSWSTTPTSRSPRRRSGRRSRSRRSTARRRSRSRPAPSPGRRSGCAAAACRTCAGPGSRGDLHVFVNVVVPTKLSKRQRELLDGVRRRGRRAGVGEWRRDLRQGPRRAWLTSADG